jgi:hypothetical protein
MLLAYGAAGDDSSVVSDIPGQFRETGAGSLRLPEGKKMTYHIYLAFLAYDRSRQSDSVYLGAVDAE